MAVPFGITGRHTPVAADDQAGVIAGILENPASHAIAAIIGRVLGKEIKYEQVTSEKFVESVWENLIRMSLSICTKSRSIITTRSSLERTTLWWTPADDSRTVCHQVS
jgi:hypothetical protein